ncbi:hypothetical protein R1sor_025955 [Riccia sorocarpa]|uniref:PLAT domain-containing protein n=1 Tax=Riccia sorocarpa TaxID=122646 RepID=A0ABD3GA17_9MARC
MGRQEASFLVERTVDAVKLEASAGSVVLVKKYTLDLQDSAANLLDTTLDFLGNKVEFQLVSGDLDPGTKNVKLSQKAKINNWATQGDAGNSVLGAEDFVFNIGFKLPDDFGEPGAILVRNNHKAQFFLESITLEYSAADGAVGSKGTNRIEFPCYSWIYNTSYYTKDRVFFSNKVYLPDATPPGLKALREQDLETGRRKSLVDPSTELTMEEGALM